MCHACSFSPSYTTSSGLMIAIYKLTGSQPGWKHGLFSVWMTAWAGDHVVEVGSVDEVGMGVAHEVRHAAELHCRLQLVLYDYGGQR